jgi:hypothetical protein
MTLRLYTQWFSGALTQPLQSLLSHGSLITLILLPSPILQLHPRLRTQRDFHLAILNKFAITNLFICSLMKLMVLDLFLLNENAGTYIIIVKNLDAGCLCRKNKCLLAWYFHEYYLAVILTYLWTFASICHMTFFKL